MHPLLPAILFVLLACSTSATLVASPSEERPPTKLSPAFLGPLDQEKVVQMTLLLENEPFSPKSEDLRPALAKYIIEAPDIEVTMHGGMLGDPNKLHKKYGSLVVAQMMFAMASHIIRHPGAKTDDPDVQLAGLEGSLRIYTNIKKVHADATMPELERLLELQAKGKLLDHVKEQIANDAKK